MDVTGVEIIVNAVVGKSLRKQEGCNSYIFDKVRERVWKEVQELVLKGTSQLDAILTQKKRLQAIFTSEKLAYELSQKKDEVIVIDETEENEKKSLSEKQLNKAQDLEKEVWVVEKPHVAEKHDKPYNGAILPQHADKKPKPTEKRPLLIEKRSIVEEKKPLIIKEIKGMVNGDVGSKSEENKSEAKKSEENKSEPKKSEEEKGTEGNSNGNKAEKQSTQSKKYFDYLAEYKNDPDVYERVKGLEIRGNDYPVSNDGSCPRCRYKSNVFVVLDFLFPAGDMPEILHYLLTLGKAVLWSSKENMNCKDPPIFLCQGKCPADIKKCGFNINWRTTDLDKIFLFPHENYKEKVKPKIKEPINDLLNDKKDISENYPGSDEDGKDPDTLSESSDDEYDEGEIDIEYYKKKISWVVLDEVKQLMDDAKPVDEEGMIRNMLALEEARIDFTNGNMRKKDHSADKEDMNDNIDLPAPAAIPEKSITTVNGKRVSVNEILDDINNRLKSKDPNCIPYSNMNLTNSVKKSISSSYTQNNTIITTSQNTATKVFTNAAAAAYAIASRDVYQAPSVSYQTKDEEKTKNVDSTPTPTHILKGATYYDETKEVKASKPAFTAHDFPISKDGACPYCRSSDVVYIILQEDGDNEDLPELLERLYNEGKAVKRKKGEYDLPSFQCKGCTYGFNLDWNSTNLEKIFPKVSAPSQVYSQQASSMTMNMQNMSTSMNYSAYNAMAAPYMYNTYSYAQQPSQAFAMNTFGYMRPVVAAIPAQFPAVSPFPPMGSQYVNYLQQYASVGAPTDSLQTAAMNYSASHSAYNLQSFRERFPPPTGNTESTFTSQSDVASSTSASQVNTTGKTTTQEIHSNNNPVNESNIEDMELDGDDSSSLPSSTAAKTSAAVSESTPELYDPFAEIAGETIDNEDELKKCSTEFSQNTIESDNASSVLSSQIDNDERPNCEQFLDNSAPGVLEKKSELENINDIPDEKEVSNRTDLKDEVVTRTDPLSDNSISSCLGNTNVTEPVISESDKSTTDVERATTVTPTDTDTHDTHEKISNIDSNTSTIEKSCTDTSVNNMTEDNQETNDSKCAIDTPTDDSSKPDETVDDVVPEVVEESKTRGSKRKVPARTAAKRGRPTTRVTRKKRK